MQAHPAHGLQKMAIHGKAVKALDHRHQHHQVAVDDHEQQHGNVAEWTRSDYVPYPYKENPKKVSEYKVVRGGLYIERPKYSTAYSRKGFYPYQCVFNVGFRVIIED